MGLVVFTLHLLASQTLISPRRVDLVPQLVIPNETGYGFSVKHNNIKLRGAACKSIIGIYIIFPVLHDVYSFRVILAAYILPWTTERCRTESELGYFQSDRL